jgi:hypothetical protein
VNGLEDEISRLKEVSHRISGTLNTESKNNITKSLLGKDWQITWIRGQRLSKRSTELWQKWAVIIRYSAAMDSSL